MPTSHKRPRTAGTAGALVARASDGLCLVTFGDLHEILQRHPDELVKRTVYDLVAEEDAERLCEGLERAHATQTPAELLLRLVRRGGRESWYKARLKPAYDGRPGEVLISFSDAELRLAQKPPPVEGRQDPLTGSATREVLMDRTHVALARLDRASGLVALMFLDLDRFKWVNDALGHAAGDEVLRQLTQRVKALLRPADTFARLGGDEFAVLVGDLSTEKDVLALAQRITAAGRVPYALSGRETTCSVSLGVAVSCDPEQAVTALLHQADLAMYRAKAEGRGRWRSYSYADEQRAQDRSRFENLIRSATTDGRIAVEYQPRVRLADMSLAGAEAQARILDDDGRAILPNEFLSVASSTGLLPALDTRVFERVLAEQAAAPSDSTTLPVALNLSTEDLDDVAFVRRLFAAIAGFDIDKRRLLLELDERALLTASRQGLARLTSFRDQGVQLGVDRFGAGDAALSVLWRVPLDYVNLDRSVLVQSGSSRAGRALLRGLVEVAHGLGLLVVAHGIESRAHLEQSLAAGCDYGTGRRWRSWETLHELQQQWRGGPQCATESGQAKGS